VAVDFGDPTAAVANVTEALLQFIQLNHQLDKFPRPQRFDSDPNSNTAAKQWSHWHRTSQKFIAAIDTRTPRKPAVLVNYVAPTVDEYIAESGTYEAAVDVVRTLNVKPKNEIIARHLLNTRRQESGESLDQYFPAPMQLSKDCNFCDVTATQCRDASIRDSFINRLKSTHLPVTLRE